RVVSGILKSHQTLFGPGNSLAIIRGTAIAAMLVTSSVVNANQAPVIGVSSPLPWLQITPRSHQAFHSKVQDAIGSDVSPAIAEVLPYSVVVTNNGREPLAGVAILFNLRFGDRTVRWQFFYHSFPVPEAPLLPAGRSLLFTPLRTANILAARAAQG